MENPKTRSTDETEILTTSVQWRHEARPYCRHYRGGASRGCSKKAADKPDTRGWFIESYNNGIVTVQHEGNTYKARCDISRYSNSVNDPNVHTLPTCNSVIDFVGQNLQPFEGKQKDANGRTINMWSIGSTLALRILHDTTWRQDEFVITSVTATKTP
jgi:hypothetical protein